VELKVLFADQFTVAAASIGGVCEAEAFIADGESSYESSREGLVVLLDRVASSGLQALSSKHYHKANTNDRYTVYEFIKGDLRLFFFKGSGGVLIVCTTGVIKKGQRADKRAVSEAVELQKNYLMAVQNGNIKWIDAEES